jgi:hypothetical protein
MKKTTHSQSESFTRTGLREEYRCDYRKARRNRFASRMAKDAVVVVLDDDVAEVFRDAASVNALLRATIAAVEKRSSRRRTS